MNTTIKNSELLQILADVEGELAEAFDKSRNNLEKAEREVSVQGQAVEHAGYHDSPERSGPGGSPLKPEVSMTKASYSASESSSSESMSKASPSASESSSSSPSPAAKAEGEGHKKLYEGSHSSTMSKASPSPDEASSPSASSPSDSPEASAPSAPDDVNAQLSAEAQPPAPQGDPAADQGYTEEELMQEYAQLAPEELDAHLRAAMQAKEMQSGAQAQPPADAAAPSPSAAPPSPSPSAAPPAMKTEDRLAPVSPSKATTGPNRLHDVQPTKADAGENHLGDVAPSKEHMESKDPAAKGNKAMTKSEGNEIEELKKQSASQKEDIENLTKALKIVLETPVRKAVTSVAYLSKSEDAPAAAPTAKKPAAPQNMKEFTDHLTELTKPGSTLSKADRDLITAYYERKVGVEKLAKFFE